MEDLVSVDYWLNNVLRSDTPLDICEKRFWEFSLEADEFILRELRENDTFDIIVDLLERIIKEKRRSF